MCYFEQMPLVDDILYLKILVFSFLCSFVVKKYKNRDVLNGLIGIILVTVICRNQILYSLGCVSMNLILLYCIPSRYLHWTSFVLTFGYLGFCRFAYLWNFPKLYPHANAVQLIMTLRCAGLAFEIHDNRCKKNFVTESVSRQSVVATPCILDAFLYFYNFVGLFTGPYYTYKVHSDMVQLTYLEKIRVAHEITPRLLITPFYVALCLLVDTYFPVEYLNHPTDHFYENLGLVWRLMYMVPVFLFLRTRVYAAWTLAECACIANGLGAYPAISKPKVGQGPTDVVAWREFQSRTKNGDINGEEFSFETIKNVDPYQCEFNVGFRSGMREWNRSVQYWLAVYIYRRTAKSIRLPLTMLVSAFWHGIHGGYYLSFLSVPLATGAEDLMFEIFKTNRSNRNPKGLPFKIYCVIRIWGKLHLSGLSEPTQTRHE